MNEALSVMAPLLATISAGRLQMSSSPSAIVNPLYSFLVSVNPFILIILGVIVFFAGKLRKFVGIVIVILGLVDLLLPYLLKAV